jgi:hypothetical protein
MESTKQYLDSLQEKYSKLNVVRVDLGYKKPHSKNITLDEVNEDFNHMLNNRRSKPSIFKDQVGYICKKEYTEDRGVHLHAVFLYDGQKVQKDSFKAEQIGEYWQQITDNKGSYHNCNRNKYEQSGIGMLDHRDSEKRNVLDDNVLSYLCKDEQDIEAVKDNSKVDRAFTRGTISGGKVKIGRPRE